MKRRLLLSCAAAAIAAITPVYSSDFLALSSLPAELTFSRAGHAMVTDSTGKLTWAPNNLVLNSETPTQGSSGGWNGFLHTISDDSTLNPVGGPSRKVLLGAGTNIANYLSPYAPPNQTLLGARYAFSIDVKYNNHAYVAIDLADWNNGDHADAVFDISGTADASATQTNTSANATIHASFSTYLGSGWHRLTIVASISTRSGLYPNFQFLPAATGNTFNNWAEVYWTQAGGAYVHVSRIHFQRLTYETASSNYVATTSSFYYGPRFDHDSAGNPIGLLVEGSRTNIALYSADISNAAWVAFGSTTKGTNNAGTAPDGTTTADQLQFSASGSGQQLYQSITIQPNTTYTISAWVKRNTGSDQAFRLKGMNVGFADQPSGELTATSVWQRFTHTFSTGAGSPISATISYMASGSASTADLLVWGFQVEADTYATSYIPTVAASVTRAAEVIAVAGVALTALTGSSWSAGIEATMLYTATFDHRLLGVDYPNAIFTIPATANLVNGIANLTQATSGGATWPNTSRAVAVGDSSGTAIAMDGGAVSSSATAAPAITGAKLGSFAGGEAPIGQMWVRSLAIWNVRLSNTDIIDKSVVGAAY